MARRLRTVVRLAAGVAAFSLLGACAGGGGLGKAGAGSPGRLAERSAAAGDYASAAAFYQQAFEKNPGSVEALVGLGRSYTGLGQYSRAQQALLAARARRPNDADVLLELARTQIAAGDPAGALANLDAAGRKRGDEIAVLTARGIALDRMSRHAEAQATYRQALARRPTDFALLTNLGLSLGLSGHAGEGITILSELARDGAATARTRGNLALVYGLAGRDKEAAAVLSTDLGSAQVQNNLAYYRELRAMLVKGRPIGNLDASPAGGAVERAAKRETQAAAQAITSGATPVPGAASGTLTTAILTAAAPLAGGTPARPAPAPARAFGPQ